ncbi:hypothetical protein WBG99_22020 [Streptomyces sp. TG1A-60]|uniref:hypothetical protein n=1 Tax=Streptomyces sp. TG1A-60 TaxID=3129111 RepID=UPI0030D3E59C
MGPSVSRAAGGGQVVALKLVRPEYADSPAFRERFAREVAAGRRVSGHHLVAIVDHDAGAKRPWLATHHVPGIPSTSPWRPAARSPPAPSSNG